MRVAVISDIHANMEALQEVLADIAQVDVDSIICLGDILGYGPNPEEAANLLRSLSIPTVMGNHELVLADPEVLEWFNDPARESLILSLRLISRKNRNWLRGLDARLVFEGALFVHASPPDSLTKYLFDWTDGELESLFRTVEQRLCFVGHTHSPGAIAHDHGRIVHHRLKQGMFTLHGEAGYIISVGSVGQPRDGINNNAKYVIWETLQDTVEVRFVAYDAAGTAEKIIAAGLPEEHARRLL